MATSGTFTGSRGGNSTGPWLTLYWERKQTDITNNRSLIRLTLKLHADYTIRFTASKTGSLHGSAFTYTGGMTTTGSKVLSTRDVWVNHNADGSKSQSFSASFNIAVSWGGSTLSSLSVSGTAAITAIPRASTLSAFSFAANLKPSTAVTINYTIDRKSTAFRHQIQLRDGSHVVQTWDNVDSNGASTVSLSTASVNSLLNRMNNVASRSLTLRVATRSGASGGWIGSAVTRSATATVDSTVKPTVSALTISQTGNSVSTHYLQGKSKVKASFTRSGGYGASISSSSITVRRKTSNTDVQTINSNDGTTGKAVSLTGTYQAQGTAKDSRGRTTSTAWVEFTVTAYSSPRITTFTADRVAATPTTVSISRAGTHSHLGGSNILTYTVQRRIGTGSWTNVTTNPTGTSNVATFSGTSTSTGNSVTASYDFRMVITDSFGEKAESLMAVSTQNVVLDIHKNEGVGIGKVHERGALDVGGTLYADDMVLADKTVLHAGNWSTYAAAASHSHAWSAITGKPSTFAPATHSHAWSAITGKPSTFAPSSHTHGYQQVARVANGQTGTINNSTWTKVSFGKTFPSTPAVVANGVSNVTGESFAKIRNRNTTGFEIIVGGVGTSNVFNWLAVLTG